MLAHFSPALSATLAFGAAILLNALGTLAFAPHAEAAAAVYRCNESGETIVYQANPCPARGTSLALRHHEPSAYEMEQAQRLSRREQVLVAQIESEREKNKREADAERARAKAEEAAREARCEKYLEDAKRADQAESHNSGRHANNAARALRNRHFSECFAR